MKVPAIILFCSCVFTNILTAQDKQQDLTRLILTRDSIFWGGYNTCNSETMQKFITSDVEFYHDKGGLISGSETLLATIKKNLCGPENFRLRRAVVEGTVKVFPLKNNNVIYGAIISGEHVFYVLEKGKPERLDGLAKFTHVWTLKNNDWRMSRILSYDHGPAPQKK